MARAHTGTEPTFSPLCVGVCCTIPAFRVFPAICVQRTTSYFQKFVFFSPFFSVSIACVHNYPFSLSLARQVEREEEEKRRNKKEAVYIFFLALVHTYINSLPRQCIKNILCVFKRERENEVSSTAIRVTASSSVYLAFSLIFSVICYSRNFTSLPLFCHLPRSLSPSFQRVHWRLPTSAYILASLVPQRHTALALLNFCSIKMPLTRENSVTCVCVCVSDL